MANYSERKEGLVIYGLPVNPVIGTIAVDIADNLLKKYNGAAWVIASTSLAVNSVALLSYVLASGVVTPTATAAAWNNRILNTLYDPGVVVNNPAAFTGTGGTNTDIQLVAGTYYIEGLGGALFDCGNSIKLRFRNITDATTAIVGNTGLGNTSANSDHSMMLTISGLFTIAATKTFQLQQYSQIAAPQYVGFSSALSGINDIYTTLKITKVA